MYSCLFGMKMRPLQVILDTPAIQNSSPKQRVVSELWPFGQEAQTQTFFLSFSKYKVKRHDGRKTEEERTRHQEYREE